MISILLLVYLLHNLGFAISLPAHHITSTFEHPKVRDLPVCECTPHQRTVWGILWSCLATVFTCTWVSVHPNIPGPDDSIWKVARRRAGLMIWTILVPELVIFWAIRQWIGARQFADRFHEFGWTKTHGYFLQMGGFMLYESDGTTRKYILTGNRLEHLFTRGEITFPTVTEEEIQDRSKGDGLTKAIALFQTTWFVVQCIARHVEGFLVSDIELVTLAFATLNGLMYFFWWNKPLAVRYSIPVLLLEEPHEQRALKGMEKKQRCSLRGQISQSIRRACSVCSQLWISTHRCFELQRPWKTDLKFNWESVVIGLLGPVANFCGADGEDNYFRVSSRHAEIIEGFYDYWIAVPVLVIGNVFAAIHCIAWSSPFPSDTELLIWRVCSLILLSLPELLLLAFVILDFKLYDYIPISWRKVLEPLCLIAVLIWAFLYTLARITLIVEAFVVLRAITPAALAEVEWIDFVPHI